MWCVLRILSRSAFSMSRLQGCYARAGLFHCMQTGSSGFRFQDAVRHGHAVFMAQGEMCPQAACFHPLGAPAGKVIGRCPAGQADGFDLAEGEGLPQTGARRLEESLLGRKVRRRAGHGMGGAAGAGPLPLPRAGPAPSAACSAGPNTRRAKTAPWGPSRLFSIRAMLHRSQPIP